MATEDLDVELRKATAIDHRSVLARTRRIPLGFDAQEIDTWDSLGVVSLAVGVEETFGYHFSPDEAMGLASIQDIVQLLGKKGIEFEQ